MTTPPTMNLVIVAGALRPAWTEGGLRWARVAPTRWARVARTRPARVGPTRLVWPAVVVPEAFSCARGGRESASRTGARRRRGRRPRGRSPSCRPSGGLRLAPEQARPLRDEVDVEERERREVHEEGRDDDARHGARARFHERRRLVESAPPVDGEVHEGDVERGDDTEHGGISRAPFTVLDHPAEQEIAEVHDEQDRHAREPRVPRPPGAPRRLAPDRSGRDRETREEDAHLRRGVRQPV